VAAHLKGVLQASLTVFGVVGGPLLGLFTVGMMFPFVSQIAAVPAFLTALLFGFWIGFGGPKPPVVRLGGDTAQCGDHWDVEQFPCKPQYGNTTGMEPNDYFYFYRVSYMYYSLIGFTITIILASILSIWFPQKGKVKRELLSPILDRIMDWNDDEQDSKGDPGICEMKMKESQKNMEMLFDDFDAPTIDNEPHTAL